MSEASVKKELIEMVLSFNDPQVELIGRVIQSGDLGNLTTDELIAKYRPQLEALSTVEVA